MFGVSAFAQEPFTSLSGPFYVTSDNGIVLFDEETSGSFLTDFISETTSLTSAQGVTVAFPLSVADLIPLTSLTSAVQDFPVVQLGNTQTLTDVRNTLVDFLGAQFNTQTLSTEDNGGLYYTDFIAEATTLSEVNVSQFAFVGVGSEGVLLTSLEAVLAQFNPACLDSLTVTNTQTTLVAFVGESLESQIVYDTTTNRADLVGAQDELVGLSTSEDVLAAFIASLADAMTLAMALSSITHYHPTCTDLITLSDYQYGRGWFKIDDNQAITWVAVDDSQASGWSPVDDSQTVIWTAVVDAQASGWSLVDDTQGPNWVNVNDIQ